MRTRVFTTAEPFDALKASLRARQDEYGWIEQSGLSLLNGMDPKSILPSARSVIVLVDSYFRESFPRHLEGTFGRCYLDDDRVTKYEGGINERIVAFCAYLQAHGIQCQVPPNIPCKGAAARAGLGTLGKNCLFYSRRFRGSSWVVIVAIVVDCEFAPDTPTVEFGCPDWCRNACIAACPTRALKGNGTMDPRRCISYLSYFGDDVTPLAFREPIGHVRLRMRPVSECLPQERPVAFQTLPENPRVTAKASHFELRRLLAMDQQSFEQNVWPHMFYMPPEMLWKWKMNAARVMGNSWDDRYIPDLVDAFAANEDERVRAMIAWALGRIGGAEAGEAPATVVANGGRQGPGRDPTGAGHVRFTAIREAYAGTLTGDRD